MQDRINKICKRNDYEKETFFLLVFLFTLSAVVVLYAQSPKKIQKSYTVDYNPQFWLEGVTNHRQKTDDVALKAMIDDASSKGWQGILYWGADRNGSTINYFHKSPFR